MSLSQAPKQTPLRIVHVQTDERIAKHLASLGIVEGESVEIVQVRAGSTVLKVKRGRLALDAAVSKGIEVVA